jgi:hypothetical protein
MNSRRFVTGSYNFASPQAFTFSECERSAELSALLTWAEGMSPCQRVSRRRAP